MQQPQLPPTPDMTPGRAPKPTHERPERKSSKFMRVLRGYLMIAGGGITVYALVKLFTMALIWIRGMQA